MVDVAPVLLIIGFAALFFTLGLMAGRDTVASHLCGEADHRVEYSTVLCEVEGGYEEVVW